MVKNLFGLFVLLTGSVLTMNGCTSSKPDASETKMLVKAEPNAYLDDPQRAYLKAVLTVKATCQALKLTEDEQRVFDRALLYSNTKMKRQGATDAQIAAFMQNLSCDDIRPMIANFKIVPDARIDGASFQAFELSYLEVTKARPENEVKIISDYLFAPTLSRLRRTTSSRQELNEQFVRMFDGRSYAELLQVAQGAKKAADRAQEGAEKHE